MFVDTLGYIGGILLAIQFIPQITKVIKTKSTQDHYFLCKMQL